MLPEPLRSDLLMGQAHGFFGRQGGSSTGIYASLNCGQGSDDVLEAVAKNRNIVAKKMRVPADNLLSLHQIHSAKVITVESSDWPKNRPQADAMVTALPDIGLGILTADCAPVLFADPQKNVIGAAHAGWKGAMTGIIENTITAMINLGAKRENIHAVIGPTISQQAYEVGQEYFEAFHDENPDYARFFINGKAGKYQFDLPGFVITKLNEQHIRSAEWVKKCTYTLDSQYFSYRRATHKQEPDYGRQISVITNSFS